MHTRGLSGCSAHSARRVCRPTVGMYMHTEQARYVIAQAPIRAEGLPTDSCWLGGAPHAHSRGAAREPEAAEGAGALTEPRPVAARARTDLESVYSGGNGRSRMGVAERVGQIYASQAARCR